MEKLSNIQAVVISFFFVKKKTAYEMRISDGSSDVCSSDLDRCMITVASLITGYRTHQLPVHIKKALDDGGTRQELAEMITHLAFYAGWPQASTDRKSVV